MVAEQEYQEAKRRYEGIYPRLGEIIRECAEARRKVELMERLVGEARHSVQARGPATGVARLGREDAEAQPPLGPKAHVPARLIKLKLKLKEAKKEARELEKTYPKEDKKLLPARDEMGDAFQRLQEAEDSHEEMSRIWATLS